MLRLVIGGSYKQDQPLQSVHRYTLFFFTPFAIFQNQPKEFSSFAFIVGDGIDMGSDELNSIYLRDKNSVNHGSLIKEVKLYPITVPVIVPCPRCRRSGMWDNFFCPNCHGYGRIQTERELSLSIPPHVRHGTEIRFSMEDIELRDVD